MFDAEPTCSVEKDLHKFARDTYSELNLCKLPDHLDRPYQASHCFFHPPRLDLSSFDFLSLSSLLILLTSASRAVLADLPNISFYLDNILSTHQVGPVT